jgi:hypothetical protein
MINVGIAGTLAAINRHTLALKKIEDIRVSGRWATSGLQDSALELTSGISYTDPESIIDKADALIITDPGNLGTRLATLALRKAKHLFLYPSVLRSTNEVYQLIKLAREANVILKCGRTGKIGINGLIKSVPETSAISMVEFQHVLKISSPAVFHDIQEILLADFEIINRLIPARNTSIKTKGISMFSTLPDIINTRLEFDNGCVVNYYCNTVGIQYEHATTVMLKDSVIRYSFLSNELSGWYLKSSLNRNENPIFIENFQVEQTDYLFDDLCGFIKLIHSGPAFLSIYDNGFESYVLTDRILEKVSKTLVQFA